MIIIVMGVTGSGKTTLGQALAQRLGLPFHDADDFHPEPNRAKLRANIPLDDEDRLPWLRLLAAKLVEWEQSGGAILACSALKQSYRKILRTGAPNACLIYLEGEKQVIATRLAAREHEGHVLINDFDRILDGQFRDLEPPTNAIRVSIDLPLDAAVELVVKRLQDVTSGTAP